MPWLLILDLRKTGGRVGSRSAPSSMRVRGGIGSWAWLRGRWFMLKAMLKCRNMRIRRVLAGRLWTSYNATSKSSDVEMLAKVNKQFTFQIPFQPNFHDRQLRISDGGIGMDISSRVFTNQYPARSLIYSFLIGFRSWECINKMDRYLLPNDGTMCKIGMNGQTSCALVWH